ncbi:MAG: hypothetical protein FWH26_09170 [Oscillospiraceae bacterium]|nr:hypothetical protein [Oscillospiraceae bacterium]
MDKTNTAQEPRQGFFARIDSTAFALRHPEAWKFIKSVFGVGAVGAMVELLSHMLFCALLSKLNVSYLPDFFLFDLIARGIEDTVYTTAVLVYAFILSTTVGSTLGFFLNRKVVFHANANMAMSTVLTILLAVFTIIANAFVGPAIVALVSNLSFLPESVVQMLGKVLQMMAATAWIYPANRFLIHREVKKKK